MSKTWLTRWRPALAGLVTIALAVALLSFAPVRALAVQFLGLFRVQQITVLPGDTTRLSDINLGVAIDTGPGGTATDPFARQITWAGAASPPDYYIYDVIPTNCNNYNYEVLYRSDGAGGWVTVQDGSNGLGIVDFDGGNFVEIPIELVSLGLTSCNPIRIEFFVTQEGGTKAAFDMVANDSQQQSTLGGTCWDSPPCPVSAPTAYLTYDPNCPAPMGVNLGWANCGTTIATANKSFLCDDNAGSFSLVGSFKNGFDVADFVAIAAAVDVTTGVATPPWFQFGTGGCREGELSLVAVGVLSGCTNPYSGANQGGGYVVEAGPTPDRFRVRIQWARDIAGALSGTARNAAFVLAMSTARTVYDPGPPETLDCPGCNTSACFVLNAVEVFSQSAGRVRIIETPEVRNWATWQNGTGGCPGATPTRKASWGQVKALYR